MKITVVKVISYLITAWFGISMTQLVWKDLLSTYTCNFVVSVVSRLNSTVNELQYML